MSEPYQIFVLIPEGLPAKDVVYGTHEVFEKMGGSLDEDSVLYLNATTTEEPEPESITDPLKALDTLATWPTLGSIDYAMPEGMTNVSYEGPPYSYMVQAIIISMLEKAFERGGEESKNRYINLARELHERFHAKRTIMDWGLQYKGVRWREEINRLQKGEFKGKYAFVDLRTDGD